MGTTRIQAEAGTSLITTERRFEAPPALIFRAWTEPDLMRRWLGPRDLTMTIDRWEIADGGRWRYVHTHPDGTEHAFRGVFHGDATVERGITQTFEYEGWPGVVSLETVTFDADDNGTVVRTVAAWQSVEARDQMVASGMEDGVNQGYDRLDELLPTLHGH